MPLTSRTLITSVLITTISNSFREAFAKIARITELGAKKTHKVYSTSQLMPTRNPYEKPCTYAFIDLMGQVTRNVSDIDPMPHHRHASMLRNELAVHTALCCLPALSLPAPRPLHQVTAMILMSQAQQAAAGCLRKANCPMPQRRVPHKVQTQHGQDVPEDVQIQPHLTLFELSNLKDPKHNVGASPPDDNNEYDNERATLLHRQGAMDGTWSSECAVQEQSRRDSRARHCLHTCQSWPWPAQARARARVATGWTRDERRVWRRRGARRGGGLRGCAGC